MSMITGCPACGTMFKVVPDQLKISEGWVRCGHCAEVFDATAHLQQQGALAQALGLEEEPATSTPMPAAAGDGATTPSPSVVDEAPISLPAFVREDAPAATPAPTPASFLDDLVSLPAGDAIPPSGFQPSDLGTPQ